MCAPVLRPVLFSKRACSIKSHPLSRKLHLQPLALLSPRVHFPNVWVILSKIIHLKYRRSRNGLWWSKTFKVGGYRYNKSVYIEIPITHELQLCDFITLFFQICRGYLLPSHTHTHTCQWQVSISRVSIVWLLRKGSLFLNTLYWGNLAHKWVSTSQDFTLFCKVWIVLSFSLGVFSNMLPRFYK